MTDPSGNTAEDTTDGSRGRPVNRRTVLEAAGAASLVGSIAGCSGRDSDATTTTGTPATTVEDADGAEAAEITATPVALTDDGMARLNRLSVDVETEVTTLPLPDTENDDETTIQSHFATYRTRDAVDPSRSNLLVDDPSSRGLAVLSTPAVTGDDTELDPRARAPLAELVAGDFGRRVLTATGLAPREGFEWEPQLDPIGSRSIPMLGAEATLRSFVGVVQGPDREAFVVFHLGRVRTETDDAVLLAGAGLQASSGSCISSTTEEIEVSQACLDRNREFVEVGGMELGECPPPLQREGYDLCPTETDGGGTSTPPSQRPRIELDDIRLVQALDNCRVGDSPGYSVSNVTHREPNPDVVVGDNATVRFELANLQHLGNLPSDVEVMVQLYHQGPGVNPDTYTFELAAADVRDIDGGTHTVAKLHDLANNDTDPSNDAPVFSIPDDLEFVLLTVEPLNSNVVTDGDRIVLNVTPPTDRELVDLPPTKIGFIQIRDPDKGSNYGSGPPGSGGFPRDYERSINSAYAYLQRNFPGEIVAYRVDDTHINGHDSSTNNAVFEDAKSAKKSLDRAASFGGTGFLQAIGTIYADSRTDSQAESLLANEGFDVVCAIIPWNDSSNGSATDYYSYHGSSGTFGKYMSQQAAVNSIGAGDNSQDDWAITTIAQEIAHYLQDGYGTPAGRPMARRKNDGSVDDGHARASKSWDDPAVWTTAYDLTDGTFTTLDYSEFRDGRFTFNGPSSSASSLRQVQSYMSRSTAHERKWTDARIYQDVIDTMQGQSGGSGSASAEAVLSGTGLSTTSGLVRYEEVHAYQGWINDFDNPHDVEPSVDVELVGPTGEVLESVRVADGIPTTHGDALDDLVSFTVPFQDPTVEVRTTAEGGETSMNPIVRGVGDAFERINERGIVEPEFTMDAFREALGGVRAAMEEARYRRAADRMDLDVGGLLAEQLREHESAANEPSREEMLEMVADMARRLRVAADEVADSGEGSVVLRHPDGSTQVVRAFEGEQSISEFYGFDAEGDKSSNTPGGLAIDRATVTFLYRDLSADTLHLVVIHGDSAVSNDHGGVAILRIDGASGATWEIQDGPPGNDAYETPDGAIGDAETAIWSWPGDRSDGGAIGPLGSSSPISITHRATGTVGDTSAERGGVGTWYYLDAASVDSPIELADFTGSDTGDSSITLSRDGS